MKGKQAKVRPELSGQTIYDVTVKDERWFSLAVKIAGESLCTDKHGCVIVKNGRVMSLATNRLVISHPVNDKYLKRELHAEQRALMKGYNNEGATLYSARSHSNPISAPCVMCFSLIKDAGISKIVFDNGSGLVKLRV
jgi:deoxycytidylate deaminase